jgi:hypothetical protein
MPEHDWQRNARLAAAIAEDGRPRYVIAAAARVNSSLIGGIVSGRVRPTKAVRTRIASALARSEHELFADAEVPV